MGLHWFKVFYEDMDQTSFFEGETSFYEPQDIPPIVFAAGSPTTLPCCLVRDPFTGLRCLARDPFAGLCCPEPNPCGGSFCP